MIQRTQVESREYTGNTTFNTDPQRPYLFIVMTGADGTLELGGGGGKIPIANGSYYEPYIAPTCELKVETTGTFVMVSSASTHDNTA